MIKLFFVNFINFLALSIFQFSGLTKEVICKLRLTEPCVKWFSYTHIHIYIYFKKRAMNVIYDETQTFNLLFLLNYK